MTYATITTTKEVLETVETSNQNQNNQPTIRQGFLANLSKFSLGVYRRK
jgi:hypothetical protein